MRRIFRSITRLPTRTVRSLKRRFDPVYRLQRQADRAILRQLTPRRRAELEAIGGTSSARECRLLAYLAGQTPPVGCIVEIGAFKGKSTAWLIEGAELADRRRTLVSIDPHVRKSWDDFAQTVAKFDLERRGLEIHRAFSNEIGANWNRPIALLWIDGGHDYEDVVSDIEQFAPHVVPNGWIVFDDAAGTAYPGVARAIAERMRHRDGFDFVGNIKGFALFRRQPAEAALKKAA